MIRIARLIAIGAFACGLATQAQAQAQSRSQFPLSASSGNVANGAAVASLTPGLNQTAALSGLEITASGATAAACVNATVTGLVGGTLTYSYCAPAGSTAGAYPLTVNFIPALPAAAPSTPIVVTLPALGAGNAGASVSAHGYQFQ
jgi:hypothetical protein